MLVKRYLYSTSDAQATCFGLINESFNRAFIQDKEQGNIVTYQHKYIHTTHVLMLTRNYVSLLFVLHKMPESG
jgi:hypothetical protein